MCRYLNQLFYPLDGDTFAADETVPDWIVIGESVLIRPYNTSGVISFIGSTDFAGGTWIGVELDAPTGKIKFLFIIPSN